MKVFVFMFISFLLIACEHNSAAPDGDSIDRTIEYKIVNKTNKDYSILFYSYKDTTDKNERDFESIPLNANSETTVFKTKYKHAQLTCIYNDGANSGSKTDYYPSESAFYELAENQVNIIELK